MIKELLPEAVLYFDPSKRTRKSYKAKDFRYLIRSVEERRLIQIIHNKEDLYDFQNLLDKTLQLFVDNLIRRVQAILIAKSDEYFKTLSCTADGALHIAFARAIFDDYQVLDGTAGDSYSEETFDRQVDVVDIFIYDNAAIIKISRDDVKGYGGEIELWADTFYSITGKVKRIAVKNKTSGSNARYKFVGWFKE
ncbi:MAG: hypothetical protein OCU22_09225 [Canidatus Methanoxibalbensis ujae]|nr:hypothetical protein [Candidatus Methanoxibalbensis ujae]